MTARLLARIAWRLGTPEQVAVEALCHILSSHQAPRHALDKTLRTVGVKCDPIARATTRAASEAGKRRVLAALDERHEERACIEPVFWSGRAGAYIESVPRDQPTAHLFVVPAARCETFWKGLQEAAPELSFASLGEDPWSTASGQGLRAVLISWRTLLDGMSSAATAAKAGEAELDIRELRQFIRLQEETDFLPLRPDEMGPGLPRRLRSLRRLVELAAARVSDKGWAWQRTRAIRNGYYVELEFSGVTFRFGIELDLWKRHHTTPLWLIVHKSGPLTFDEVRRRLGPLLADTEASTPSVPIKLPVGVEEDQVLGAVVRRLEDVAKRIDQGPGRSP